jgi:hypothetical protein
MNILLTTNSKIIFMVWAPYSPRAENLSEQLGAQLYLLSYKFKKKIYWPIKYPILFVKTFSILKKERPDIIISQIPPVFCSLSVLTFNYCNFKKKAKLIIDAHSGAFDKPWSHFKLLHKSIMKRASIVIVTTMELQNKLFEHYDTRSFILEDRVPNFDRVIKYNHNFHSNKELLKKKQEGEKNTSTTFSIAIISSFAWDEPLDKILYSAEALPDVRFYITGEKERINRKDFLNHASNNVFFTGFLNYADYISFLQQVDVVMVLTTKDKTTLSGGYEALALAKPLITSNSDPLIRYFTKGAIFVDNSIKEIKEAIRSAQTRKEELTKEMFLLKEEKTREWEKKFANFKDLLLSDEITY